MCMRAKSLETYIHRPVWTICAPVLMVSFTKRLKSFRQKLGACLQTGDDRSAEDIKRIGVLSQLKTTHAQMCLIAKFCEKYGKMCSRNFQPF